MSTSAISPVLTKEPAAKMGRRGRKPLSQKTSSTSEANILAAGNTSPIGTVISPLPSDSQKENLLSAKKSKPTGKSKLKQLQAVAVTTLSASEKELQETLQMLKQLKIEKEKTEELLKEKDEMLRVKDEELKNRGMEQEKLQVELKKLQKMKEFKPTLDLPMFFQSVSERDELDKKKKKKKKGCPEMKRPAAAYLLWSKDQWNEVKKSNPDADFKEISTVLGAKWKTLTPEEKRPYEERYQTKKEAYLKAVSKEKRENEAMKLLEEEHKQRTAVDLLEQYLQFKQEAEKKDTGRRKSKKEKDPLKPKQPMSAFFLFANERRAGLLKEGKNLLEVSKMMGEEWKKMGDKQRKPYEERAKENKERYLGEMEVYIKKKEAESADMKREEEEQMKIQKQEALQLLKKKEKNENIIKKAKEKKKNKKEEKVAAAAAAADPNKPKRPMSSYFLFSKDVRKNLQEERPGINNSVLNALISVKWKELSDEEKQVWNQKAVESMEAYKKEMEQYNKKTSAAGKV